MTKRAGRWRDIASNLIRAFKVPWKSGDSQLEEENDGSVKTFQFHEITDEVMEVFVEKYKLKSILSEYTTDRRDYVYRGRDVYFNAIFQIFAKSGRNNVLLTGKYGSGRDALANGIAERIKKADCPRLFWEWDMVCLDLDVFLDERQGETLEDRLMLLEKFFLDSNKLIVYIKHIEAAFENEIEQELVNAFSCNRRPEGIRVITTMETEFCERNSEIFLKEHEGDTFEILTILPPEEKELYNILRNHIESLSKLHGVEVEEREFRKLCNETVRINNREVQLDMILDVLDAALTIAKLEELKKLDYHSVYAVFAGRMYQLMRCEEADRRFLAEHEAAHTLVSVLTNRPPVSVTIVSNDVNLGTTSFTAEETIIYSEDMYYDRMAMLMAPYALNHRVRHTERHDDTAGDRKAATIIALEMLLNYGMSANRGPLGECTAYSEEVISRMGLSDQFCEIIAREVEAILQRSIDKAAKLLESNMDKHKLLTEALLRNASLTMDEVQGLVNGTISLEDLPDPKLDDFA